MNFISSSNAAYSEMQFNIDPAIHERYIELLCKYEVNKVYPYVQQAEGYRLDRALEVSDYDSGLQGMEKFLDNWNLC